jgi:hypothetical protein
MIRAKLSRLLFSMNVVEIDDRGNAQFLANPAVSKKFTGSGIMAREVRLCFSLKRFLPGTPRYNPIWGEMRFQFSDQVEDFKAAAGQP